MSPSPNAPQPGAGGEPVASQKSHPETPGKTPRPAAWRRWVFWGVVVVLVIALGAEFRAQDAFNRQLKICQQAAESSEDKAANHAGKVFYDDIKGRFASQPDEETTGVRGFAKCRIYVWHWRGIRPYTLRLIVDATTGQVLSVESGSSSEEDEK
jgi:hypothetical protein